MASANMRRSQVILRLPVDNIVATLTLHDGARSEVVLFVSPNEDLARLLSASEPFVPMIRNGRVCLVARAAIACLAVPARRDDGELPIERQTAKVRLRSGVELDGELRWVGPAGQQRTADHLNSDEPHFELHAEGTTHYVVKAHVATVEEFGC